MIMPNSFELCEFFHLTLLRHLSHRLAGRAYAVKGGICMRFFHRSPRLSQDMDLDVVSQIRVPTLRQAVDTVLRSRALMSHLIPLGVLALSIKKPKQTDTTQRWKVGLQLEGDTVQTKIEFSRRSKSISFQTGVPHSEILRSYKSTPFAAPYYDEIQMTEQKLKALAATTRTALRDLFDLHHLFTIVGVDTQKLSKTIEQNLLEAAIEKVEGFTFLQFREQVLPYLTGDLILAYNKASDFNRLKDETNTRLIEMLK